MAHGFHPAKVLTETQLQPAKKTSPLVQSKQNDSELEIDAYGYYVAQQTVPEKEATPSFLCPNMATTSNLSRKRLTIISRDTSQLIKNDTPDVELPYLLVLN